MVFFFVSVYISVFKKRLCNVFSSSLVMLSHQKIFSG